jgi:hypothetical protein
MLTVIEGRGLDLEFFRTEDVELTPDSGSVSVSITNLENQLLQISGEDTPELALQIPEGELTVSAGELASFYNLRADYTLNGVDKVYYDLIRVIKNLPITVAPTTVQNILGVSELELESSQIDIYGYYMELTSLLAVDIFSDVSKIVKANQLLAYFAAFNELQTLSLKVLQTFSVDDYKKTRYSNVELQKLSEIISQKYWSLRSEFDASGALPQEPLVQFATRTDVVTGA